MFPYIINSNSVTIVVDGVPHTVDSSHFNYERVLEAIRDNDEEMVRNTMSVKNALDTWSMGQLTVRDSRAYWNDFELDASLTTRLIEMIRNDLPVDPLVNFISNLMQNPSNRALRELYRFMEHNMLPITSDGYFLAYKRVRDDYTDVHSGTFNNRPGEYVSIPRNQVDDDANNTCSHGLHFCSREYLDYFGGSRIVIVKINPADVVSIPVDYNNSKGRTCAYTVIQELEVDPDRAFNKPVQDSAYDPDYWDENMEYEDDDDYWDDQY